MQGLRRFGRVAIDRSQERCQVAELSSGHCGVFERASVAEAERGRLCHPKYIGGRIISLKYGSTERIEERVGKQTSASQFDKLPSDSR